MKNYIKRLQIKGFVVGVLLMLFLSGVTVFAAVRTETINVTFRNIQIVIDGEIVIPRDVHGNIVEPFVWNGTTYLPVRAIADALGNEVDWDDETSTVYLDSGATPTPTPVATPIPTPVPTPAPTPVSTPSPAELDLRLVGAWGYYWMDTPEYVFNADGSGAHHWDMMVIDCWERFDLYGEAYHASGVARLTWSARDGVLTIYTHHDNGDIWHVVYYYAISGNELMLQNSNFADSDFWITLTRM